MAENLPKVSISIPCKDENYNIDGLLTDISHQKIASTVEVIEIRNISPAAKARNSGAYKAKGEILVFIDCDIRLGNDLVLDNLVKVLLENDNIGAVCPSIRISPEASRFQVRYAREIPHSQAPIVDKLTDISVTSACCVISKDLFLKLQGFNENLIRGEDPELSFRLRKAGYRTVLAPHTWCYHPLPENIIQLIKIHFRDGLAVAFADIFYPELNIDIGLEQIPYPYGKKTKSLRYLRYLVQLINAIINFKILLLFAKLVYAFGYLYGVFKYGILK